MRTLVSQPTISDDLLNDERWLLVQRIASSPPFQKSGRLRELLQYITDQTIRGHAHELSEQHIGEALFHKPSGYSPLEDSSVRVHVRQLRLKLHEYFDGEGRSEPLILEIPKGSYAPTFRSGQMGGGGASAISPVVVPDPAARRRNPAILPWILCGILAALCIALIMGAATRGLSIAVARTASPPWPFSQIFDSRHQTVIVVADSNYGMFRILTGERGSLAQYLRRDFLLGTAALKLGEAGTRFTDYISIGSPASNPWVSLFQDKLNFRETEAAVGKSAKAFVNTNPLPGEQPRYEGLRWTGTLGEDYATIALLPNATHDGSVLTLQGLQQEGTEAAGRFMADEENRRQLLSALGISASENLTQNTWFEALIRSRTVSGAPNSTTLVAVRRIR